MKALAHLVCLLAIVLNVTVGHAGSALLCEHVSGSSHLVSEVNHAAELEGCDPCQTCEILGLETCDDSHSESCSDLQLGSEDSKVLNRSSGLDRVASPPLVAVLAFDWDIDYEANLFLRCSTLKVCEPIVVESLTGIQVKRTVLRV